MRFRDLAIGDTFDWINDARPSWTSFHHRCVKVSARRYRAVHDMNGDLAADAPSMTVGTINASVFHIMRADD